MKNKNILIISIVLGAFLFVFSGKVLAADLTISCDSNNCRSSEESLFNHTNISPGFSVTKTVRVDNLNTDASCDLRLQTDRQGRSLNPDLADKLSVLITREGDVIFGNKTGPGTRTISDLFGQNISWGTISANSTAEYSWKVDFNSDSKNEYQNTSTSFDFSLDFTCNTPTVGGDYR